MNYTTVSRSSERRRTKRMKSPNNIIHDRLSYHLAMFPSWLCLSNLPRWNPINATGEFRHYTTGGEAYIFWRCQAIYYMLHDAVRRWVAIGESVFYALVANATMLHGDWRAYSAGFAFLRTRAQGIALHGERYRANCDVFPLHSRWYAQAL